MARLKKLTTHVLVCAHKTCLKQGAKETAKELKRAVKARDLRQEVMITEADCLDQCGAGPVVAIYPDGVWYGGVDGACADAIVKEHVVGGRLVTNHVIHQIRSNERISVVRRERDER